MVITAKGKELRPPKIAYLGAFTPILFLSTIPRILMEFFEYSQKYNSL